MRIILILFLIFNISFAKCMEHEPQERTDPFNVESPRVFVKLNGSLEGVNPFHLKDPAINYYHACCGSNFLRILSILSIGDFKEAFNNDVLYKYYNKEIVNAYYKYRLSTCRNLINERFKYWIEKDYQIQSDVGFMRSSIFRIWFRLSPLYLNKEDFLSIIYTAAQRKYSFFFPHLSMQELIFLNFIRLKPQEKINNYETIKLPNQSGFTVSQDDIYNVWDDVKQVQWYYWRRILERRKRTRYYKLLFPFRL